MKKISTFSIGFLILVIMTLAGCSNEGETTTGGSEDDSNTLVIAQAADIPSIDPQNSLSTTGDRVHRNMFSRLFMWDNELALKEDLVDTYKQIDEETWEFTLKEAT
ncbi:hypothetical protein FRY77_35080, partial [Halomonas sp. MG34]|nr:hypothetical protein [Halomonas sp. MG34]